MFAGATPEGRRGEASVSMEDETVSTEGAGGFIDGMAFHWYAGGGDRLLDGTFGYHRWRK